MHGSYGPPHSARLIAGHEVLFLERRMKRFVTVVVGAVAAVVIAFTWAEARTSESSLEGAWAVQDITSPRSPDLPFDKPTGLIQFTGRHYSMVYLTNSARPNFDQGGAGKATADQLRTIWGPLTSNAGTFTVTAKAIRFVPTVGKNPAVEAGGVWFEDAFTLNGDTLVLTQTRGNNGPAANPLTIRLTRAK